jgi:hypothetical protein
VKGRYFWRNTVVALISDAGHAVATATSLPLDDIRVAVGKFLNGDAGQR